MVRNRQSLLGLSKMTDVKQPYLVSFFRGHVEDQDPQPPKPGGLLFASGIAAVLGIVMLGASLLSLL